MATSSLVRVTVQHSGWIQNFALFHGDLHVPFEYTSLKFVLVLITTPCEVTILIAGDQNNELGESLIHH